MFYLNLFLGIISIDTEKFNVKNNILMKLAIITLCKKNRNKTNQNHSFHDLGTKTSLWVVFVLLILGDTFNVNNLDINLRFFIGEKS